MTMPVGAANPAADASCDAVSQHLMAPVAAPEDRAQQPLVVGLQPVALVDHAARVSTAFVESIPGERGGSVRVSPEALAQLLVGVRACPASAAEGHSIRTLAGGSVANTLRGLASGFGVRAVMLGAAGDDDLGHMFATSMAGAGVELHRLRRKAGLTGQCVCLVDDEGGRTMRTCMQDAVRLQADELTVHDLEGAQWLAANGYALYGAGLLERAVALAKAAGARVCLDFASFEVVRAFKPQLLALLQSRQVDLCFANEDEARELVRDLDAGQGPVCAAEAALDVLAQWCPTVVVMLGPRGCIARTAGRQAVRIPALPNARPLDTTGAGDLFASGFLSGLLRGRPLEECCRLGCAAGGAVIRELGGEVGPAGWDWMRAQQAGSLAPQGAQVGAACT
ncbi:pfkB family carbohydrate kinase [Klebsormidium nitens]|uniref:PfkB family carbohydrate kinase n=1 Tax=Klebsormidium nitens TaxID=105231 RepID=A0A1Y1IH01_KLENI|nr:pfkB family carbohydrate kinase [Klebsormidium nitens]|eukprot:GAQ87987.1 pfkB family carbohydrate kinase [Klebsormidium nitens]